MSAAVASDVNKKFGKPGDPFWQPFLRQNGHNGSANGHNHNGRNLNGQKRVIKTAFLTKADNQNGNEPIRKQPEKQMIPAILRELREQHSITILLTNPDKNKAEMLCDRIAIINSEKVVALDTPSTMKSHIQAKDGNEPTPEDIFFLKLTGKQLGNPEVEEEQS